MRLLLDCTHTVHIPTATGIQRVVRNLINHAGAVAEELGLECQPVYQEGDSWRQVDAPIYASRPAESLKRNVSLLWSAVRIVYRLGLAVLARVLPHPALRRFVLAPGHEFGLTHMLKAPVRLVRRYRSRNQDAPLAARRGDVLVTMDIGNEPGYLNAVKRLRALGVAQIALVYDIIPTSHPEVFVEELPQMFTEWLHDVLANADAVLAISAATQDTVRAYLAGHPELRDGRPLQMDWFHPGSDLDGRFSAGIVRPAVQRTFAPDSLPTYLCVGTLEPRKNLSLVLDAFERLWAKGLRLRLCFIGQKGWKVADLFKRIARHSQRGAPLLHLEGLNDAELDFAYRHARGLVFASIAEGFGLPLVEGISCGLTAFTSDIPVFREIGENVPGDRLRFFDSASPDALARAIADFEHRLPAARPRESFVWPTWERSTLAFLVKAQALAEGIAAGRETAAPAQRPALIPAERIATES